nr:hypothetical protein [uncultured Duganella sp.]
MAPTLLFGLDVGKGRSIVDQLTQHDSVKRLSTTLRLDAESGTLAASLGAKSVTFNAERTWWRLPLGDDKKYRVSKLGFSIYFTDEVSLDYSYVIGQEAPTFNFSKTASFGLGLKF